jgi:hypothetical protein
MTKRFSTKTEAAAHFQLLHPQLPTNQLATLARQKSGLDVRPGDVGNARSKLRDQGLWPPADTQEYRSRAASRAASEATAEVLQAAGAGPAAGPPRGQKGPDDRATRAGETDEDEAAPIPAPDEVIQFLRALKEGVRRFGKRRVQRMLELLD